MKLKISDVVARAKERGYPVDSIWPCVIKDHGDGYAEVDLHHISYPRAKPGQPGYAPLQEPPTLLQKAVNFGVSAIRHAASGAPVASPQEIEYRFSICRQCEFFNGSKCLKCGCPIKEESATFSKLSWAGESCPVGKWGPVSS